MDTVCGVHQTETRNTSVNGQTEKQRATEFTHGSTAIDMRASGVLAFDMVTAVIFLQTVTHMSVNTMKVHLRALVSIDGKTAQLILENLELVLSTGRAAGSVNW